MLSCDRYHPFAEHMLLMYERLWPDHPFVFRIPYQTIAPTGFGADPKRVEPWPTSSAIRATVLQLLADLDDEEMIYWCLDDKYPIWLHTKRIKQIIAWLARCNHQSDQGSIDGILFCRCRRMWEASHLTGASIHDDRGNLYLERKNYEQIWIHQLVKVKVIRRLFEAFPDQINQACEMDGLKRQLSKPTDHRLYVSQLLLSRYGESTHRGRITANCLASMQRRGLAPAAGEAPAAGTAGTAGDAPKPTRRILMGSARDELFFDAQQLRIQPFLRSLAAKLIV